MFFDGGDDGKGVFAFFDKKVFIVVGHLNQKIGKVIPGLGGGYCLEHIVNLLHFVQNVNNHGVFC